VAGGGGGGNSPCIRSIESTPQGRALFNEEEIEEDEDTDISDDALADLAFWLHDGGRAIGG
jgi:hypothetical protein